MLLHSKQASLPGTFLQALPKLVTPLKGHSISLSCPPTLSAPSDYGSSTASKHAHKREARPPRIKKKGERKRKKKEFCLDSVEPGFVCTSVSNIGGYKRRLT